ncbi:DUF4037 domain-containing protein [Labedaea rhizosphaerae]|uniref:Uncharacterized protein DUF4037 n=1 Tax=Labedaea rhizosphaerae TaxID=598644 RepID=A0A4R6SMP3_LABRH|nr:DUF4037 domain-containing protein [Labedaea rhizosphaerae]TDQ05171.1 uncharacterized protein DUF4037 [Labedaea rhizosphaerae]
MQFTPGLELSALLYGEAVRPLLDRYFPGLPHTAALIGPGSEVLGYDTARSTDHDWGPRLQLFLTPDDLAVHGTAISTVLATELPPRIAGYPTNFVAVGGTHHMEPADGPIHHAVAIADLGTWLIDRLGFDPLDEITVLDWLATPTQVLAELTSGAVFHDGLSRLAAVRQRLAWYPDEVWRYVLACQWQRLSEEEPFVGRCAEAGDELGSAVLAARLVRDVMRLCLLLARRYPPYSKWLGSAFAALPDAGRLRPLLTAALAATDVRAREASLASAYELVAELHNASGLTDPVDPTIRPFHGRPYRVLHAERFTEALRATIEDPDLRALPMTGAIDQVVDNVAAVGNARCRRAAMKAVADVSHESSVAGDR